MSQYRAEAGWSTGPPECLVGKLVYPFGRNRRNMSVLRAARMRRRSGLEWIPRGLVRDLVHAAQMGLTDSQGGGPQKASALQS